MLGFNKCVSVRKDNHVSMDLVWSVVFWTRGNNGAVFCCMLGFVNWFVVESSLDCLKVAASHRILNVESRLHKLITAAARVPAGGGGLELRISGNLKFKYRSSSVVSSELVVRSSVLRVRCSSVALGETN